MFVHFCRRKFISIQKYKFTFLYSCVFCIYSFYIFEKLWIAPKSIPKLSFQNFVRWKAFKKLNFDGNSVIFCVYCFFKVSCSQNSLLNNYKTKLSINIFMIKCAKRQYVIKKQILFCIFNYYVQIPRLNQLKIHQ